MASLTQSVKHLKNMYIKLNYCDKTTIRAYDYHTQANQAPRL